MGVWFRYQVLAALLSGVSGMLGGIFAAKQKSKYFFYSSVWGAIVSIVSMSLLIPRFQLYGATASVCFSFLAMTIARYCYTRKDLQGIHFAKVALMFIGYIILAALVPMDMSRIWKFFIGIIVIAFILLKNRDVLTSVVSRIKRR